MLTEVYSAKVRVSTISTIAVTTRVHAKALEHVAEYRKALPENHWKRLHDIKSDLQKELEVTTTATDTDLGEILDETIVTITLSKLLLISRELHT